MFIALNITYHIIWLLSFLAIYAPLSVLWECDSQHTDSMSSNTEPDVTSELEHLCQDLSLEPSMQLFLLSDRLYI